MKQKKEKSRWQKVNDIILILHIIFPAWIMAWMYTPSFSNILFLISLSASLLLGIIYKLVKKYHKGKLFLYISRGIAICSIIAFYTPMLILMNFSHSKLFYSLKRLNYIYGVYGNNSTYYEQLLPPELPAICDDYSFRTQGSMIAQDYHPSSYLIFHTNRAALDSYALHFDELNCTRRENTPDTQEDIEWFCGQMRLRDTIQDNLDHAVLYWFDGTYPKAVLLNYETGLVAILT